MRRLVSAAFVAFLVGFFAVILTAAASAQTVTRLSRDSVAIADSWRVAVPLVHDTTVIHDTTRITLTDTLRVPYPVYDTVTLAAPILRVDTTVAVRTAGDSTITTRRIITQRGSVDTVTSVSVVVAVVGPHPDSVRIKGLSVYSRDTTKLTASFYTYPKAGGTVNIRILVNGVLAKTAVQVGYAVTVQFPRPKGSASVVACAKRSGDVAETCSPAVVYPIPVVIGETPPPPDTSGTTGTDAVGLSAVGMGPLVTDSGIPVTWRPNYTGKLLLPLYVNWHGTAMNVMVRDTVSGWTRTVVPGESNVYPLASWMPTAGWVGMIEVPRPTSGASVTLMACGTVYVTDSTGYRLCTTTWTYPLS